ncbi:unnamed protein product [Zymoseptoria tritici ST99CH_1A5]|uniref:Major facilitator superfamily (MFS) profile domain-containing protein n=3 Tax=Zymoseptoria tritici TaxID=1047171 RepID=A0A1X7RXZ6_ZYMT9|nr:unnamed protein product [Zymoseptoria tritici ST99CH_3D7]SMR54723.1 unnamed protein product [Zymoseptoria tritici ST99CH_1E4]SMR56525.1 unnamed protein product [Zymoseptoria tritici ST99CH_3D1]SMY25718.1 unnamed protein product [Zymoseptoria tritici ST99CH_1A5]
MTKRPSWYTIGVAIFAATGTFFFGFDTGIATTTIAHDSWKEYMKHPPQALVGGVAAIYVGGETVGAILQTTVGDRLGRIRFMQLASIIVTIGVVIQTASQNMPMFLTGRGIAGVGVGAMVGTVPVYLSEIAAPHQRGLVAGISGIGIAFGTMSSNWVGFACAFAPYGPVQWRLPLATQIPWGVLLFIGLCTFMPDSPRHLIRRGKIDQARAEFAKIRRDLHSHEAQHEFNLSVAQIQFEQRRELKSYRETFKLFRHRILVCIGVQLMTSLVGSAVVLYNQTILYKSMGLPEKTVIAMAGVYGTLSFISNVLTTRYLADQWGRRKMMLTGLTGIIITLTYTAIMQHEFQHTDNQIGKGFTVLGLFLYGIVFYGMLNSTTWTYGAEIVPVASRSKAMGLGAASHFIANVALTEAGPTAFATIHENYYYVFVGFTAFFLVVGYFYFPETKNKTLEEVAAAFGDRLVTLGEPLVSAEENVYEKQAVTEEVESGKHEERH